MADNMGGGHVLGSKSWEGRAWDLDAMNGPIVSGVMWNTDYSGVERVSVHEGVGACPRQTRWEPIIRGS